MRTVANNQGVSEKLGDNLSMELAERTTAVRHARCGVGGWCVGSSY